MIQAHRVRIDKEISVADSSQANGSTGQVTFGLKDGDYPSLNTIDVPKIESAIPKIESDVLTENPEVVIQRLLGDSNP